MTEHGCFIEVGILSCLAEDEVETFMQLGQSVQDLFPDNQCVYCDSINKDDMIPGWTIGMVESFDKAMETLIHDHPECEFILKEVDNHSINYYIYRSGIPEPELHSVDLPSVRELAL